MKEGTIVKVAGPLVIAEGMRDANMFDVVRVSEQRLIGEIIEMHGDRASIQVYEETSGLGPGEKVVSTGVPLSVELGPGLIGSIFDGIQRPLEEIMRVSGTNLERGVDVPSLSREKKWHFTPTAKVGDEVRAGDELGFVQETAVVRHKIMVPPGVIGTVKQLAEGDFTVEDTVGTLSLANGGDVPVKLMNVWPVRVGRPYSAGHGSARHRHPVPHCKGRRRSRSGPVRFGQDGRSASARKMGGRRHHRLHRLRRTRQRDDRRFERIS